MAVKTFSAYTGLTASDTNTYLANAGLVYVKSQTVGSGVSTQNILACFNGDYDQYVVTLDRVVCSAGGGAFYFKLLQGSTPNGTGFYANTFYIGIATGGGLTNAPIVNGTYGECGSMSSFYSNHINFEILAPFQSTMTRYSFTSADNTYWRFCAGIFNASTSFDGLQILPSSGTMTGGTITVYGRRRA